MLFRSSDLNKVNYNNTNSSNYLLNCSAFSDNAVVDGTYIEKDPDDNTFKCNAKLKNGEVNDLTKQAFCLNVKGDPKLKNHSQKTFISKLKSNSTSESNTSVQCPKGYKIIDGDCLSYDINKQNEAGTDSCDKREIDFKNNKVTAYNKEYGNGVYASINCMKLNVIDDNCIDSNLETECRTGSASELPYIDFKFNKNILIKKIVIYNRSDGNKKSDNYPLKIGRAHV